MSKEAMQQALEALEEIKRWTDRWTAPGHPVSIFAGKAITPLQKALANEALDKKAENAKSLGLDYGVEQDLRVFAQINAMKQRKALAEQPAQQEHVGGLAGLQAALKELGV